MAHPPDEFTAVPDPVMCRFPVRVWMVVRTLYATSICRDPPPDVEVTSAHCCQEFVGAATLTSTPEPPLMTAASSARTDACEVAPVVEDRT